MEHIVIINLFTSFFLCGLIWVVQLVHYPFFKYASSETFEIAMGFHRKKISLIVVPAMFAELLSSFWLSLFSSTYTIYHISGFVVVLLIWGVTFTTQVPLHSKLTVSSDAKVINKLVRSNWIRTTLWSAKALIGIWLLKNLITL
jgi:hypothetical protein